MTFDEVLDQVRELLQQRGRVTYRSLKLRYQLDDEMLAGVIDELVKAEHVATKEDEDVLVWTGRGGEGEKAKRGKGETEQPLTSSDSRLQTLDARRDAGERRQLTVMFIDLVGSTTLSQQLDPEDYHARVVAYQTACHQVIARYEGHIAQYLGDGVLVYFGYPTAHEEDAVRAVRSGLEIVTAVRQLAYTPSLQVRIGIHTGPVVVGEIGAGEHTERLALGETPNIAARVQGVAEPDTVVVSIATHRLVHGLFECQVLGPQTLKGISTPLSVYRVIAEGAVQSRFEAAVDAGLTPLVGREEELALLQHRWDQAKAGAGQVVFVSGEPGIGKSRLVQEVKEHVSAEGATRIEFRCSPYHQNSAFYPLIDHLQRLLQFAREDSPAAKLEKLQRTLSYYRFPQADTVPLLATLLSLPQPEGAAPLTLSPQKQKQKTQEALVAWIIEEAEKAAVYCAWEDLHWADPSTLEVLTFFLDQVPTTRMLALLTFRPEFTPPWSPRSYLTQITLSRLGRPHVETMVEQVTRGKALPAEVLQHIVAKTDGVPLFVEELTKTVLESGLVREEGERYVGAHSGTPIPPLAIPSTLQDSLMARLDRLAPVKELAQLGATLGREFSYEVLHAISPLDEGSLQQGLRQLVEAELLYQRGLLPHATYLFKHALIQDAAYQSLLKSKRQQLHQQIAQMLVERFPETVKTQPELVAHHYTEAGLIERALPYWQQAGQKALERSTNAEAISHLTKGLELLPTLPETSERVQQELTFQLALNDALAAVKGYAAPEVERTALRIGELCQRSPETPHLTRALLVLWSVRVVGAEYDTARTLAEQFLSLVQRDEHSSLHTEARYMLGTTLFYLGQLSLAHDHLTQGIALYDPQTDNAPISGFSQNFKVGCLSFDAKALWHLGYSDQSLKRIQEALSLAQQRSHPFSLAYALFQTALHHQLRREEQAAQEWAEKAITLSTELGFHFWLVLGTIVRGWALAERGQAEEGIGQLRQGLAACRAAGAGIGQTNYLAMLAEGYAKAGQAREGLTTLAEALDLVQKTGERSHEAELYRLKGELLLTQEGFRLQAVGCREKTEEAEGCFLTAIDIAQKQQAKSLELRAVMSLARLWQQQGKQREAHQLLAEIYNWFTEGFDTRDLQEAKILLEELSD